MCRVYLDGKGKRNLSINREFGKSSKDSQVPNSTNDGWNPRDQLVMAANARTRKFTCKSENSPNALCMSNTGTSYYQ
jgi:hypothetical protein